ncbi:uridine kinase [Anopheles sinensis]|uniref:Uridine kinase n=1 Tax=Anopheles sinensis TaxID=74873 RepID=A0A084WAP0_ANOSI|nr:uridine kinase [Anopheles sinensis]
MAIKLFAILATFACVSANYVPVGLNLPYAEYGTPVVTSVLPYVSNYAGYNHVPQVVQQVSDPVFGNYVQPHSVPVTGVVPAGKTTVTKTFVSTPTCVTSHVSERVHTDAPVRPHYGNYGHSKNVVTAVPSVPYAVNYAAPVPHGVHYGW